MAKQAQKLSVLLTSLALIAFAVPGSAMAGSVKTEGGVLIPAQELVTLTNQGQEVFKVSMNDAGTIACSAAALNMEVTSNNGEVFKAAGLAGDTASGCVIQGTNHGVTISRISTGALTLGKSGTGILPIEISAVLPGRVTVNWKGEVAVTYTVGSSYLSLSGSLGGSTEAELSAPAMRLQTRSTGASLFAF
jgi:hypothetical protein